MAYRHDFLFHLGRAELWRTIEHVEHFHRWWPWFQEVGLEGDELRAGAVLHGVVAPPLPYRMRIDVELVRCDPERLLDAVVDGDLRGQAQVRLSDQGDDTQAQVAWSLEMMQRPMRVADRMAHPLMQWGHDRVVEMTVAGFRHHVEHPEEPADP